MAIALITGSSGLIGSEAAKFFHEKGLDIIGIDNNLRQYFFGRDGSIDWKTNELTHSLKRFKRQAVDIRNQQEIFSIFKEAAQHIKVIIHAAAQPSHDWAAKEPFTDFSVNATGTLTLLEATRTYCPDAVFIFTSTNKVYGDTPNFLPLVEKELRWEINEKHKFFKNGIDETMSIDQSKHSVFGASKVAADIMTQEYGRYFALKTGVFRGGCLTGPAHSGAELHGFLSYLVKCTVFGRPYSIFGYKGKQVRDNIHSHDLVNAFWQFFNKPRAGEVYNIGGGRHANCSMLEAIEQIENLSHKKLNATYVDTPRAGDHIWWVSSVEKFKSHYPDWSYKYDMKKIIEEIVIATKENKS